MSSADQASPSSAARLTLRRSEAPQIHAPGSSRRMMWSVTFCLLPAALFGVVLFGPTALGVLAAAVVGAVATESIVTKSLGLPNTLGDGSAVLTGLLLGMSMPPTVGLHVPIVASVFAVAVVKWTFGGLGKNWMNPALAGRVFVYFSFEAEMTEWSMPALLTANAASGSADAVSGATILGLLNEGLREGAIGAASGFLRSAGFPVSEIDVAITNYLNERLFSGTNLFLPTGYVDPFLGLTPGSVGEVSALLLLAGTVYLWSRRVLRWEISLSFFLSFAFCTWAFGGIAYGSGAFTGDVLLHLLSGGLVLGMFYMANDPVTSPMSPSGMLAYGTIAGVLTFLVRFYGAFPEGVALGILLANVATPLIDRSTRPSRFGAGPEPRTGFKTGRGGRGRGDTPDDSGELSGGPGEARGGRANARGGSAGGSGGRLEGANGGATE